MGTASLDSKLINDTTNPEVLTLVYPFPLQKESATGHPLSHLSLGLIWSGFLPARQPAVMNFK